MGLWDAFIKCLTWSRRISSSCQDNGEKEEHSRKRQHALRTYTAGEHDEDKGNGAIFFFLTNMPQEKRVTKVEDTTRKKVEATSCRPCFRVRRQGWIWVSLQAMLRLSAGTVYLLSIPLSPTPPSTLQPSRLPHLWLVDIHTLCRTLVPKQSSKSTNLIWTL